MCQSLVLNRRDSLIKTSRPTWFCLFGLPLPTGLIPHASSTTLSQLPLPHRLSVLSDRPPLSVLCPFSFVSWPGLFPPAYVSFSLSLSAGIFSAVSPSVCLAICVPWTAARFPPGLPLHPWLVGISRNRPGTSCFLIRVGEPLCGRAAAGSLTQDSLLSYEPPPCALCASRPLCPTQEARTLRATWAGWPSAALRTQVAAASLNERAFSDTFIIPVWSLRVKTD